MNSYTRLIFLFMPVIFGGILNMVWVKLPIMNWLRSPMDRDIRLRDGRALFGRNKTWKGFLGMIVLTAICMQIQAWIYMLFPDFGKASLIDFSEVSPLFAGSILGLGYALAELPNSFIKRRINIEPGTNAASLTGRIFTIVDQADSVVGSAIALSFFYSFSVGEILFLILFGTAFHYVLNVMLYLMKLKKQAA